MLRTTIRSESFLETLPLLIRSALSEFSLIATTLSDTSPRTREDTSVRITDCGGKAACDDLHFYNFDISCTRSYCPLAIPSVEFYAFVLIFSYSAGVYVF